MSSGATHWCYSCSQPIVIGGRDAICPYCDGGFVQELNELPGNAPPYPFSSHSGDLHQMPDIFDAIHAVMARRGSEPRVGLTDAVDNFMRQRMAGRQANFDVRGRSGSSPVPDQSWSVISSGPYLKFHGQVPGFTLANGSPRGGPSRVELPPQGLASSRGGRSWGGRTANSSGGNDNSRVRENTHQNHGRRNPLSFLWPFRSTSSNNNHYAETGGSSSSTTPDQNNGTSYSGWPFD